MRRYGAKKVPKGASTRNFALLGPDDQIDQIKKLHAAHVPVKAIAELIGWNELTVMLIVGDTE